MVAFILNIDTDLLEEGVIDKDEYINVFDSFFAKNGKRAILIHFQSMKPPPFGITSHSVVIHIDIIFHH